MEGICDICGDTGVADALVTCIHCKINTEHMYCMRTLILEPVDDWGCEECESSSKPKPPASCLHKEMPGVSKINPLEVRKGRKLLAEHKKLLNESRVGTVNWEKMVATGKTKYISVKEAILMSSGEKKFSAASKFACDSKPTRSKIGVNKLEKTPFRTRTLPISSQQVLASGSSGQPKPQRIGSKKICERLLQQSNKLTEVLRSTDSIQPSEGHKKKLMQKEQPRDIEWVQTKSRRLVKQQSSLNVSSVTISGGNGHATIEQRIGVTQNMNNNVLPDIEKHSSTPASDALWKGSFSIQDDIHGELNYQIQAHPASIVSRKAYGFSKKMPEVLHFQLVPARTFCINLFKECIPNEKDIALYFFPCVSESRSKDHIHLLEFISQKNLALRVQIGDVELLVFASKLLPQNYQCWEGKYFLWGVFRRLKRDSLACLDNMIQALSVQLPDEASYTHDQVHDDEHVDMDMNKTCGIDVGRRDVPVPLETHRGKCTSFREESAAAPFPVYERHMTSDSRLPTHAFDNVITTLSQNVKMEINDPIPPGFEEVYKLRIQGSS